MKEILTETYENHNHSLYGFENGESCTRGHNPRMAGWAKSRLLLKMSWPVAKMG